MSQVFVLFLLILGGLLLVPVAERLRLPAPALTAVFGLILGLIPGIPLLDVNPDLILPILLPPLLYAAARRSSWRQFAANIQPILLLAVALVFITAAVAAAISALVHPLLPVGAAIVLGAVVAPPDAAAVTTIAGRLGLPRRLVTIMEGEGLFNDVVALTMYQVAVAGVVAGTFSISQTAASFGYSAVAAIAVGLIAGFAARTCINRISDSRLTTAMSLLVPYLSYLPAEAIHASGVLAVLTSAFFLGAKQADPDDIEGRLVRGSFWEVIELMVTAVTFGIVGLELVDIIRPIDTSAPSLALKCTVLVLGVIVSRTLWMFTAMWITRWRMSWTGHPIGWRATLIVAWSGMRGVVTIVTALALPKVIDNGEAFPGRQQIQILAVSVVVVTLLAQGLTLPWLINKVGLRADAKRETEATRAVVKVAREAAAQRLHELTQAGTMSTEMADRLTTWYADLTANATEQSDASDQSERTQRQADREQIRRGETELLAAARGAVVEARTRAGFDPTVVDEVLQLLDIRSAGRRL